MSDLLLKPLTAPVSRVFGGVVSVIALCLLGFSVALFRAAVFRAGGASASLLLGTVTIAALGLFVLHIGVRLFRHAGSGQALLPSWALRFAAVFFLGVGLVQLAVAIFLAQPTTLPGALGGITIGVVTLRLLKRNAKPSAA